MINVGYYNGEIGLIEDVKIPMNDRAVYFGDGIYEVAYVRNHKIFALDDHIDRFYINLKLLLIDFKMTRAELKSIFYSLMDKLDGDGSGLIYWQVSRGSAPRNHAFPSPDVEPNLLIYIKTKEFPLMKKKIRLMTMPDERFLMCNIKTLNLLPNILARQKAEENGYAETILHRDNIVTECSHSNIGIIKSGVFRTAPLSKYILPGTVRKHVLEICGECGIPVDETAFTIAEMMDADEIVTMSTTAMVRSAYEIENTAVGGKNPELIALIQDKYSERVDNELK